jgi:hypothetical protein
MLAYAGGRKPSQAVLKLDVRATRRTYLAIHPVEQFVVREQFSFPVIIHSFYSDKCCDHVRKGKGEIIRLMGWLSLVASDD